jgi:GT2 family glycosyltransferase
MSEPILEIMVPVRNGGELLTECLESLFAQEESTMRVTVVDNASTDDTRDRVTKKMECDPRLHYVRFDEETNLAGNFNRCISLAKAPYFTMVHADDRVLPNYFVGMKAACELHSDAWLVFCQAALIDDAGDTLVLTKDRIRRFFYHRRGPVLSGEKGLIALASFNHLMAPCAAYRRSALGEEMIFQGSYRYLLDQTYWLRVLLAGGTIAQVPDVLYEHRVHSRQLSSTLRNSGSTLREIDQFTPSLLGWPRVLAAWRRYKKILCLRNKLMEVSRRQWR